jgi:hypothetical protein
LIYLVTYPGRSDHGDIEGTEIGLPEPDEVGAHAELNARDLHARHTWRDPVQQVTIAPALSSEGDDNWELLRLCGRGRCFTHLALLLLLRGLLLERDSAIEVSSWCDKRYMINIRSKLLCSIVCSGVVLRDETCRGGAATADGEADAEES